jgi:hypothetical protein
VLLDKGVFIAPDNDVLFGGDFANYFNNKSFDWRRLAGAQVLEIGGLSVLDYIDYIARNVSGTLLDHNARVNSVVSSYQLPSGNFSQRLGDLASRSVLTQTSLTFSLIPVNSTSGTPETVDIPFVAIYGGQSFADGQS